MKRYNDYFTLLFVTFLTLFSFFHMSTIVDVSHDVITIVFKNLLPSLLPFMILVSLCLNLGILDILAYFLQIPFYNLFSLTPILSPFFVVIQPISKLLKKLMNFIISILMNFNIFSPLLLLVPSLLFLFP